MDIFPINIVLGEKNCVYWKYTCRGGVLVARCRVFQHKTQTGGVGESLIQQLPSRRTHRLHPLHFLLLMFPVWCRKRQLEWIKGPGLSHPPSSFSFPKKSRSGAEPGRDLATAAAPPLPPAQLSFPHGQEIFLTALNSQFWA